MTLDDVRASLVQLGCPASARGTADSYSIGIPFPLSNFSFFIQEARTWTRVWKGCNTAIFEKLGHDIAGIHIKINY